MTIREFKRIQSMQDLLAWSASLSEQAHDDCTTLSNLGLRDELARSGAELALAALGEARQHAEVVARVGVEIASELGVPQRKIAELVGVAPATVLRWIRNPIGYSAEERDALNDELTNG